MRDFVAELVVCELGPKYHFKETRPIGEGTQGLAFEAASERHGSIVIKITNPYGGIRAWQSYETRCDTYYREHAFLTKAHSNGVRCPEPLAVGTLDAEHTEGGPAFLVMKRLPGKQLRASPSLEQLVELGALVGTLHRVPADYYEIHHTAGLQTTRDWPIAMHQFVSPHRSLALREGGHISPAVHQYLIELIPKLAQMQLPPTLNHGDLCFHNVLIDEGGTPSLLDFGFARMCPGGARDLAHVRGRLLVDGAEVGDGRWRAFFDSYMKGVGPDCFNAADAIRFELGCLAGESLKWFSGTNADQRVEHVRRVGALLNALSEGVPLELL
jgi:tRNA A-37 threonylcarbamoyl transferase component Bud32